MHGRTRAEVEQQAVQVQQLWVPPAPATTFSTPPPSSRRPDCVFGKAKKANHVPHQPIHARARARRENRPVPRGRLRTARQRRRAGPVVIWNLIRRCNLTCKHCYALSADHDYEGELSTSEVFGVMDDLKAYRVPVLILSGGEPLMRPDIFEIAERAKAMKFYTGLSTNGTLIDEALADRVAATGFDYVGISLDGLRETHDHFRRLEGAFDRSRRRTPPARTWRESGAALHHDRDERARPAAAARFDAYRSVRQVHFSHLNYAGRGNIHRGRTRSSRPRATRWTCCSSAPGRRHRRAARKTT